MNKAPRECGVRPAQGLVASPFIQRLPVLAHWLRRWTDFALLAWPTAPNFLVRDSARADAAITALAWDDAGRRLLFGGSNGAAGLLTMPG